MPTRRLTACLLRPPERGLRLGFTACLGALLAAGRVHGAAEELHSAAALRALSPEEAGQPMRVKLRGVVTFFDEGLFSRFLQDVSAGIYLQYSTNVPPLAAGQWVEVEGTSSPGEYAPILVPERVRLVGQAPLPPAKVVSYDQLASGSEDSQLVEVTGIVRWVQRDDKSDYYVVEIATGGGRLPVYARQLPVERNEDLLDSTVRVRGVCSTQFNHQRQLFAIRLLVARPEDLEVEAPALKEPFALKARPVGSLLQFEPQTSHGHRIRVSGTVIYHAPGKVLYLQDGVQGLEVQSKGLEPLQLGDVVEAVGFVSQGQYTPFLEDAIYRKIGSRPPPPPRRVSPDETLKGKQDCCLIQVAGKLVDRALHAADRYLLLEEGGFIFHAYLNPTPDGAVFAGLRNGSRLAVTGVCRIDPGDWRAGEDWRARGFRVELRSAADVAVLASPPWWTLEKVLWVAGALGFAALAALAWVGVLRRQVAERTRELGLQIEERQRAERRREIEQERTRVAQDLHDELGATLTEVGMLSVLAGTPSLPPEKRAGYLDQLTQVSRSVVATLDEIVWAVNPKYDSVASLASYYSLFAQRFLKLAGIACRLEVAESFPESPLDSRVRHGVFLAFKEALNNAARHSQAAEVRLTLKAELDQLAIIVADNGTGFSLQDRAPGSDGLASMRERLAAFGGHCFIRSQPGRGTSVEFRLPLAKHAT